MYKVKNRTSKEIGFGWGEMIKPNQEIEVEDPYIGVKSIKDEDLGVCEIFSDCGVHKTHCYGNLVCKPERGIDGVTFVIKEKKPKM